MKFIWVLMLTLAAAFALTPEAIIKKSEDLMRGDTGYGEYEMIIKSPRYERTLLMESWGEGTKRSFIRILQPKRDAGTTFLKLDNELWQFVPRIERTVKIPPSMMLQQWMGSDFTNDDMVKESSMAEDYDAKLIEETEKSWLIALTPKPEAAVVWGRIEARIAKEGFLPQEDRFYDEKGVLVRTMHFSEVKKMDDRVIPTVWRIVSETEDKKGNETVLIIRKATFNRPLPEDIFTLRALKSYSR